MSFATAPVTHPHRARDALPSSQNRPLSARTRGDPGAPVGGVPVYHQLTKFLCFVHPRTGLVLPSTEVAGKPHADKIPPPLSVPRTWRGRLHLRDQIALARQLEFGKNLKTQDTLRRLLVPFFPAPDIPAVKVPPHVFGGHSNWEDVIDCLLFFFSLDTKLQEEHLQAATESRSKWYKKNIDVLCENRPTSYHIVMRFFPPSPGDEIIAAVRSKNAPSVSRSDQWKAQFRRLKEFKEQHGHCAVPKKHPGGLRGWAIHQRSLKRRGRLDAGRDEKLDELGFWCGADEEVHAATIVPDVVRSAGEGDVGRAAAESGATRQARTGRSATMDENLMARSRGSAPLPPNPVAAATSKAGQDVAPGGEPWSRGRGDSVERDTDPGEPVPSAVAATPYDVDTHNVTNDEAVPRSVMSSADVQEHDAVIAPDVVRSAGTRTPEVKAA